MTESQWPPLEDDLSSHTLHIFCRTCFIFIRLFLTVSVLSGDTTFNPAPVTVLLFPISQTEAHCPALNKNLHFLLSFFCVSLIFLSCTQRSQFFFSHFGRQPWKPGYPQRRSLYPWCMFEDVYALIAGSVMFPRVKLLEHVETLRRRNLLGMSVMATAWTGPPGNTCWKHKHRNIQLSTITQIRQTRLIHIGKKAFSAAYF